MASVEKREARTPDGKVRTFYLVRWRDPSGKQRTKSYARKTDSDKRRKNIEADLLRDEYIDPSAGKVTFEEYATTWLGAQTFDPSTAEGVEMRLRVHVFPALGTKSLRSIKPSMIQAWIRGLGALAPTYQQVLFAHVSTVFSAAVDDELIRKNPCRATSVTRPRAGQRKVTPWAPAWVGDVRNAHPERYKLVVTLAAGLGLRQGEVFGLSPEDVDFLRGRVTVRRQVKLLGGTRLIFALPKGRKVREVPLPGSVRDALAAYLTRFPPVTVELPWETVGGKAVAVPLVLTTRDGTALNRNYFNGYVWKDALKRAGVPATRENGCHALRHFYASTLLHAGESIKAVSEYLGHGDAGFTLRTYTHLMPSSDERSRQAVDAMMCVIDVESRDASGEKGQVKGG
jgi:integrase